VVDRLVPELGETLDEPRLQVEAGVVGTEVDAHDGTVWSMTSDGSLLVLGADGCRGGGWVVALIDGEGELRWEWADDTAALLAIADEYDADALAIDVPIGLPGLGEVRACDGLARARLGARRSSVFAAPPREVLDCVSYAAARPLAPSLSAQAFGLVPRIREVDEALRAADADIHLRVVECHPEVAFASMAAGRLPLATKKSAAGSLQRLRLLEELLDEVPYDVPAGASLDDALDAAACAAVAHRWATGGAEVLGGELDALGVPMRIVV
jgi:predicted RNase H-like nuclease